MTALSAVWHGAWASLVQAFLMLWDTLWALILGFGLAGAVQAFVPRDAMRARLGDHRPKAIAVATAFGMVSSSCSYAASAMAKSLFAKGADFVTSLVFMFASTNLVIELGIVLVVLMGWQFAAAEFAGGAIMIVLLAVLGGLFLTARQVQAARARLESPGPAAAAAAPHGDPHDGHATAGRQPSPAAPHGDPHDGHATAGSQPPWRHRVRTRLGWTEAAGYTVADLTMLRKELIIGFLGAGLLAAEVPAAAWNVIFLHGHGAWTSVENAVVGPLIALASFVCSIGNVPLAAALWQGGISFGGVVSFIFADLIALPLVLIYRKYYGTGLALRMLALFWTVMSLAGLAAQALFRVLGLVPAVRPGRIAPDHLTLNYTTILNIVFLAVLGILYWLHRHRSSYGGTGYANDPICGMQVETAHAPATLATGATVHYFCSDHCHAKFAAEHAKSFSSAADTAP